MIAWICARLDHKLEGRTFFRKSETRWVRCLCEAKTWRILMVRYRSLPYKAGKQAALRGQILVGKAGGVKTVVHLRGER